MRNENCPICGERAILRDRCMYGGSVCDNGHEWYYCPADKNRVIGQAPKGWDFSCHCSLQYNDKNEILKENGEVDEAMKSLIDQGAEIKGWPIFF